MRTAGPEGPEVLGRFVQEQGGRAISAALALCGDREEAKELVQEACYRVLRSWGRYEKSKPLNAWFLTVLRNLYLDGRKRCDRRCSVSLDEPLDGSDGTTYADALPEKGPALPARLEQEEAARALRRALENLSRDHRAVLTLCDLERLGCIAVAERLGVSQGTVRSRLSRARRLLRRLWSAGGDFQI